MEIKPPIAADNHSDFSLVQGGPLFQLMVRAGLIQPSMDAWHRVAIVLIALTWLPMAILSAVAGTLAGNAKVPFLYDLANLLYLISVPILIGAELIVHRRIRGLVRQFVSRELIAPEDQTQFESILNGAMRLRNSGVVEVLLLFVSFTGGYWVWRSYATLQVSTWYASSMEGVMHLNVAGYWLAFVSLPIGRFIVLRWYFRLFNWYLFLWRVSRLRLQLNPLHPDRAGGLGFLENSIMVFAPVLIAQSIFLAALIGNQILHQGAKLPDFKLEIVGFIVIMMSVVLFPLTFFVLQMVEARLAGARDYGQLAGRYVNDFRQKWLQQNCTSDETLLGTADIQSLADLANSFSVVREMRLLPFDRSATVQLAIMIALPLSPLCLTMVPFEELLDRLFNLII